MVNFVSTNKIEISRELSDLDRFTLDFVDILAKSTRYVVVSGYVAILLGRSRVSEDVDIIIPKLDFNVFNGLLGGLVKKGFYCLNATQPKSIYGYLARSSAVRFAKVDTVIPNIELKFAKNKFDDIALQNTIRVKINDKEVVISHLELQIAFKEEVLKSPKDLEDAKHIRNVASGHLDNNLVKKYKGMLHGF